MAGLAAGDSSSSAPASGQLNSSAVKIDLQMLVTLLLQICPETTVVAGDRAARPWGICVTKPRKT